MRRRLSVFVVVLTALVLLTYSYLAWSLTGSAVLRGILALPFISIWMIPVIYWARDREHKGALGVASKIGVYFLMVGFGAGYGYTVMSRISLLIGRYQFLLDNWLGLR